MKWQGRERSSNIEDRRGDGGEGGFGGPLQGGGGRGIPIPIGRGGIGIGGIIVIGIICLVLGINPLSLLDGSGPVSVNPGTTSTTSRALPPSSLPA